MRLQYHIFVCYKKREKLKTMEIYKYERKTTKGQPVIYSLAHIIIITLSLALQTVFLLLFNKRPFLMTLCSNRTVSCHIRDWFLTKYKWQTGILKTKNNTTSFSKQFNTLPMGDWTVFNIFFLHFSLIIIRNAKIVLHWLYETNAIWWSGLPNTSVWAQKHRAVSLSMELKMSTSPENTSKALSMSQRVLRSAYCIWKVFYQLCNTYSCTRLSLSSVNSPSAVCFNRTCALSRWESAH